MSTPSVPGYAEIIASLRIAYNGSAAAREQSPPEQWKVDECARYLTRLQQERKSSLIEIGPGPGTQAKYFHDNGLDVFCIDLSEANVQLCRSKGLDARVMDMLDMDLGGRTFDSALAINCLLHMPVSEFPRALRSIREVLHPGGLLFVGQYGGFEFAGFRKRDTYEPKRFYSFITDEQLLELVAPVFEVVDFRAVPDGPAEQGHFQALTLRNSRPV